MPGMKLTRRALFPLGLTALLPGCGFRPMYASVDGKPSAAAQDLAAISIGVIADRPGQMLREALQDRFERQGVGVAHRYDLAVAFNIGQEGIAIQPDTSTTYSRVRGTATWTLTAQDPTHKTLTTGTAIAVDGYNFVNNQFFFAQLWFENIQRHLAQTIADEITVQLSRYFTLHPTAV
jgi:LPS-assembly lipoprotein